MDPSGGHFVVHVHEFFRACETGDHARVQEILDGADLDIDIQDNDGHTALQVSAANDQVDIVRLLLKRKAGPNIANSSGWTPLHHACFHGHSKGCDLLVCGGANLSARNKFGATPLNVATASGHQSTVKILLASGAPVDEVNPDQFSNCPLPVSTASIYSRSGVLRTLLERQVGLVNLTNPDSLWSPLMLASSAGSKPIVQLLIAQGADPNQLNALDETALDIAVSLGRSEVKAYLDGMTTMRKKTADRQGLVKHDFFEAIRADNAQFVNELVTSKLVDVNCMDGVGATGLMIASISGNMHAAQALVQHGARLNVQDGMNGWTALMQATFYGHQPIAKFLLDKGADPTVQAFNGCTALDLASLVEETDTDILRLLAGRTIDKAPPLLLVDFKPSRKPTMSRSVSVADLTSSSKPRRGFKAWLGKVSGKFRKLKPETRVFNEVRINVIPSEQVSMEDLKIEDLSRKEDNVGVDLNGSVFTLGFSAATTDLSSYGVSPLEPPRSKTIPLETHQSFLIPQGFPSQPFQPAPKLDKLLLNHSESKTQSRSRRSSLATGRPKAKVKSKSHQRTKSLTMEPKPTIVEHRFKGTKRSQKTRSKRNPSVRSILGDLDLLQFHPIFKREEIDMEAFKVLNEGDLKDLGVEHPGDRQKIIQAIKMCQSPPK